MNRMNTATVGLAVTPTVLQTFLSHVCFADALLDALSDSYDSMRSPEDNTRTQCWTKTRPVGKQT